MRDFSFPWEDTYKAAHSRKRKWRQVLTCLAAVVVFCTTYALILPAITLEATCSQQVHVHSEDCYGQLTTVTQTSLQCGIQPNHVHSTDCYNESGVLCCGYCDYILHTHDALCYNEDGSLRCQLPERFIHSHTDSCYSPVPAPHQHNQDCYALEQEALICQEVECPVHTHGEDCYDEADSLICTLEETPGHTHGNDCYSWQEILDCPLPTEAQESPVLSCGQSTQGTHHHSAECRGESGTWICGQLELEAHQHTQDCLATQEVTVDTDVLTCTQEHEHSTVCYGTWILTCQIPEHAHTEECYPKNDVENVPTPDNSSQEMPAIDGVFPEADDVPTETEPEETTPPLKVEDHLTNATLSYLDKDSGTWKDVKTATSLPGDASLQLTVYYEKVNIDNLKKANYQMTFALPELLRETQTQGTLVSGGENIGSLYVHDGIAALHFDPKWVSDQTTSDTIYGDFYIQAQAKLSSIPDGGSTEIQVGNVTITIPFEGNLYAQYAQADIKKSVGNILEEADGDYLEYTLTVTAGPDGCPDVQVRDAFGKNKEYIHRYVLPNECTGVSVDDSSGNPGVLTWTIGNMAAGETKTLTYRVLLNPGYTGAAIRGQIDNTATVYANEYPRDSDTAHFVPSIKMDMRKTSGQFIPTEDGGGKLEYTIWIKADTTNSYTLDNLTIRDALDGSIDNTNPTDSRLLPYVHYEENSFHLYKYGQDGSTLEEITDAEKPVLGSNEKSFSINVGSVSPGEERTLKYTVKIDKDGMTAMGNNKVLVNNRAAVYTDPNAPGGAGNQKLQAYKISTEISSRIWSRKLVGSPVEQDMDVTTTGETFYDLTGGSIQASTNPGSFQVPSGSYCYQIVANESGDWDYSSAVMKDDLQNEHMEYVSYVQVNAYEIENGHGFSSDQAAVDQLSSMTPTQTVWLKVSGSKNFSFQPHTIGLEGKYAYLLRYYAHPINMVGMDNVVVANQFLLTGDIIGANGVKYTLTGLKAEAIVTVQGENGFSARKDFWYMDRTQHSTGNYPNGCLYWAIRLEGSQISANTVIRDQAGDNGGSIHYFNDDSLLGVFLTDIDTLSQYPDYDSLLKSQRLTPVETSAYKWERKNARENSQLNLTFLEDISLPEGKQLYIFLRTANMYLADGKESFRTYNNTLYWNSPSNPDTWVEENTATHIMYGHDHILKKLEGAFTYQEDTDTLTSLGTDISPDVLTDQLSSGIYTSWSIQLNYVPELNGSYRVLEQLPSGMELCYLRLYQLGNKQTKAHLSPIAPEGWESHSISLPNQANVQTENHYATKGNQVLCLVEDIESQPGWSNGEGVVQLQVVCRITDPDVLMNGKEARYINTVQLQTQGGIPIGTDTDSVSLKKPTLQKSGIYDEKTSGGKYPFQLTINELGMDMVPGADEIILVDEMCDLLVLDATSIQVLGKDGNPIEQKLWKSSLNGHTLYLTLPDSMTLTVKYEAFIQARPGDVINIQNSAHWYGYASSEDSVVSNPTFQYSAGGSAGANASLNISIIKLDKSNNQLKLSGAEFTLVEGIITDGTFTRTGEPMHATSSETGEARFADGLKFNTIYQLTETKAPVGYKLDSTPHYLAMAKKDQNENYPEFDPCVHVQYGETVLTYQVYNGKGEIKVEKKFQDAAGNTLSSIQGTYRFGLYTQAQPTGEPEQTVSIVYSNGAVTPKDGIATFTGLEMNNKTYYVYELDTNGKPILGGSGTIGNVPFLVSYDKESITLGASHTEDKITVTNRMNYAPLPSTGGIGLGSVYLLGSTCSLGAAAALAIRKKKKRKG